jgi:Fe(3+) dicitrate transport protein
MSPLLFAQSELHLRVTDAQNGNAINDFICEITRDNKVFFSDETGLAIIPCFGEIDIKVSALGYSAITLPFKCDESITKQALTLEPLIGGIAVITADSSAYAEVKKLLPIQDFGIYLGRSGDVIQPAASAMNVAANNAREQFSGISGLNIQEDGSGLQLSIGGRGLDPNRSSNFSFRQNGVDISADPLGYPENYYQPPVQAIDRIEVLRGSSALQYGSQFGGLIHFIMKRGDSERKLAYTMDAGYASFNTRYIFQSAGGSYKAWNYYLSHQYRAGDGWRENGQFESHHVYTSVQNQLTENSRLELAFSAMHYLTGMAGGLTDRQFNKDPRQSTRSRNWFLVDWLVPSLKLEQNISHRLSYRLQAGGIIASRKALGFLASPVKADPGKNRELISGDFRNIQIENRWQYRHQLFGIQSVNISGWRYFLGNTKSIQGPADEGDGPSFQLREVAGYAGSDFGFDSRIYAVFSEEALFLNERWKISAGLRAERIETASQGSFEVTETDFAGNILPGYPYSVSDSREANRWIFLGGMSLEYDLSRNSSAFLSIVRNYRAINFSDLYIRIPGLKIDPGIKDEQGWNGELGWKFTSDFANHDVTLYTTLYNERIGLVSIVEEDPLLGSVPLNLRTNTGNALLQGLEYRGEFRLSGFKLKDSRLLKTRLMLNGSYTMAKYLKNSPFEGNFVEFVPEWTLRCGLRINWKSLEAGWLLSATGMQFGDAINRPLFYDPNAIAGAIPEWLVHDVNIKWQSRRICLSTGVSNVFDRMYFTRRASGYPGPGIIPSDGRSYYCSIQLKI